MFKNVGKSIKSVVKAITCIQIILYCLIGIIAYILLASSNRAGLGLLIMLAVAGIGCFAAWLSALILYAFGEMADGVIAIRASLCGDDSSNQHIDGTSKETLATSNSQSAEKTNWICYSCKASNPIFRAYCVKCGTARSWSEQQSKEK